MSHSPLRNGNCCGGRRSKSPLREVRDAGKGGYVGVFSSGGKLVAFSDDASLVKRVASELVNTIPTTPSKDPSSLISNARKEALRRIAGIESEGVQG
jgi:hypothetical protein